MRKRKSRDGASVSPVRDLFIVLTKNNEVGDGADNGATKRGRLGDVEIGNFDGSKLAEASVQPH